MPRFFYLLKLELTTNNTNISSQINTIFIQNIHSIERALAVKKIINPIRL